MTNMTEEEKDETLIKTILEISEVLERNGVSLIARNKFKGGQAYPVVGFQLIPFINRKVTRQATHMSNRCHATGYELQLIAGDVKQQGRSDAKKNGATQ